MIKYASPLVIPIRGGPACLHRNKNSTRESTAAARLLGSNCWLASCAMRSSLLIASATFVIFTLAPAYGNDICRPQRKEPAGCFDLRLARDYEKWERWKEAEQEYIQAGRTGAPCVRKEALEAIQKLRAHRPKDESNFEFELGQDYSARGALTEAEQHYSVAGKDRTEVERKNAREAIKAARQHENFNFELALARHYSELGAWKEAEQHYSAAGNVGTADQRREVVEDILAIRELTNSERAERAQEDRPRAPPKVLNPNIELALAQQYLELGAWEEAKQHYSAAANVGTEDQRKKAQEKIATIPQGRNSDGGADPQAPSLHPDFELALAKQYLEEGAWKEAEVHYSAAGVDESDEEKRQNALNGVKIARERAWLGILGLEGYAEIANNMSEKIDHFFGLLARLLGLTLFAIALLSIAHFLHRYYGGIAIMPFDVSQGTEAERLSFAFARAREKLRQGEKPRPEFFLPIDDIDFPEALDIGDVKLPLAAVIRPLKRAKIRVKGSWVIGGEAKATINRRHWFFGYKKDGDVLPPPRLPPQARWQEHLCWGPGSRRIW